MTPIRYFGGTSARKNGDIRLLQAKTFKDLVESYIYVPVAFPMTRHEFNALSEDERNKRKDGPYICAASFPFDEGKRENITVSCMPLAIFDIDDAAQARGFFECPATLREAMLGYNYACYTTAKHTPENPRLKLVIELEPCTPEEHRRIVKMIARCLGFPSKFKGERETLTLSLPQYRPLAFQGEDFTSVISSRLDGVAVKAADAPELPEDEDDPSSRVYHYEGDDIADLMFMPSFDLTVEDIREPLFAIDAGGPYQIWTHVACALRHNFPGEEQAREAFDLFVEWSMTGANFKSVEDCFAKWRSFRPYAKGRRPITIGTLYKLAMDAGWVNTKLAAKVRVHVSDWIKSCDDADVLLTEGAKRISEMPFKNKLIEESLGEELRLKLKSLGSNISKASIMAQVKTDRFAEKAERAREEKPAWLLPFCFIGPQNLFRNNLTGDSYSPEAFNNTHSRFLVPKDDDTESDPSRALVMPVSKALNEVKIKVVDAELYDPREQSGNEPYFEIKGRKYVNTYRHSSLPDITAADIALSKKAGRLMKKLIEVNVGNAEYERTVLDVMAFVVQRPGVLLRWSIFMQGAQGCGKGTLFDDCMGAALGQVNVKIITASAMTSTFDDWRAGSQWCHIDEIKAPGKNRFEVVNRVKDAITNTVIPVNQKFKDIVNIPNVTNYVLSSNSMDALALEDTDRRFFVLISLIQSLEQVRALNDSGLTQKTHALIESNPGAFRHFLLEHEISENFPVNGPAPQTRYRQDLIDGAKNALQSMVERLIADVDQPMIGADVIHLARLEALTEYQARDNARVTHYLRVLGFEKWGTATVHGEKTEIWTHTQKFIEGLEDPDELLAMRYVEEI